MQSEGGRYYKSVGKDRPIQRRRDPGTQLSEFHSGYRAGIRALSDLSHRNVTPMIFILDTQIIIQLVMPQYEDTMEVLYTYTLWR